MSIEVLAPGLLTSVQDAGRPGWRHLGVARAGAADGWSLAVANLLVGNPVEAAALEITLQGPTLRFPRGGRIAITGATVDAHCDGEPVPGWRTVDLPAGAQVFLGHCRRGARAYLAIAGGVDVPRVLGSRSTDLRAGFGGQQGRALRTGDLLPTGAARSVAPARLTVARRWVEPRPTLDFDLPALLRYLPGSERTNPADALAERVWRVAPRSDRQGLRLAGDALALAGSPPAWSEAVSPGTIQLPPDGQPIVLGADAQTIGGYPRIGHVIAADGSRMAQLRPGEEVWFLPIDGDGAARALRARQAALARLALALSR